MIKLIASDMDGTLLNEELVVSQENAAAIKRAQEAGIHFVVATGRSYETGYNLLQDRDIRCPFIALNGAEFYDEQGNRHYTRHVEKSDLQEVLDLLAKYPIQLDIATPKGIYTKLSRKEYIVSVTEDLLGLNPNADIESFMEEIENYIDELRLIYVQSFDELLQDDGPDALKIIIFSSDNIVRETVKAIVEQNLPSLIVTSATPTNLEINTRAANKGQAVADYAQKLGIQASEVAAIGDSFNDLTMLEWAKYSFAVANAAPEIKNIANHQTVSHKDHAVAKLIDDILAGKYND